MKKRNAAALLAVATLTAGLLSAGGSSAVAGRVISPSSPSFSYEAGPYTNVNVGGLLLGSCELPEGCHEEEFTVNVPSSYYKSLRARGRIGVVQISLAWPDNEDDFDLTLANTAGDPIATSGFGNSTFERIAYTELPSGTYKLQAAIFRVANSKLSVDVRLVSMPQQATAVRAGTGGVSFSHGTPVALERSSGEPNLEIAPNGDIYADIPLGAGTNSIFYKSTDNGQTFRPMAPLHPNNNPLSNNAAGGGDSGLAIEPSGRMCFSELNTLLSLGIGCSADGGKTWTPSDPLIIDPATPLVDRQWQVATPQGEQFIAAQFGIVTAGPSAPGIRAYKEVQKTGQFVKVAEVDTGEAMKSYNLAADPSDTDANGGTVVQAYLRPNNGSTFKAAPHQLMIWRTTDGGTTVTKHKVADLPTTPGNNFASVAIDRSGNIYVAWTEQGTWDVLYSVAPKSNPNKWSKPVRVNAEPAARTSIQPTIKVGDRGRVFVGFYGAEQYGNPDKLQGGVWHAYLSVSTNGACMLDARPCKAPTFYQSRISDHPMQHRGICLGGTGCGGDPYYGDRSMLEYLDIEFMPGTGQAHVITTDSSRSSGNTTITMYSQTSGPSAFARKPAIRASARRMSAGAWTADRAGDAIWPYDVPLPDVDNPTNVLASADGADITGVRVSRPSTSKIRFEIRLTDASLGALDAATMQGAGADLLVGVRFATETDVFWTGLVYNTKDGAGFKAGHLENGILVDAYTADATIPVQGMVAGNTLVMDLPLSALETTPQVPEGQTPRKFKAVSHAMNLYAVTGFSFVSPTTFDDPNLAKRLMDVAPAFTLLGQPPARRR